MPKTTAAEQQRSDEELALKQQLAKIEGEILSLESAIRESNYETQQLESEMSHDSNISPDDLIRKKKANLKRLRSLKEQIEEFSAPLTALRARQDKLVQRLFEYERVRQIEAYNENMRSLYAEIVEYNSLVGGLNTLGATIRRHFQEYRLDGRYRNGTGLTDKQILNNPIGGAQHFLPGEVKTIELWGEWKNGKQ